jgi:hypothetical protein
MAKILSPSKIEKMKNMIFSIMVVLSVVLLFAGADELHI